MAPGLRALAHGLLTRCMIVSFLGTKGGTGTTTLAVNCAADIRRITNRSTVVVDLKSGPGDVALFLGLRPRHSLLTALDHLAWIDPPSLSRYVDRARLRPARAGRGRRVRRARRRATPRASSRSLRALNSIYDFVILDVGTSLMTPAAAALQLSDSILLVANPDVPCLRNLQRLIDARQAGRRAGERLQIVLNRASEFGVLSTAQIERVLGLNIAFSVNSDYRTVASAVNSGVPVSALRASELNASSTRSRGRSAGVPERQSRRSGVAGSASRNRHDGRAEVRLRRVPVALDQRRDRASSRWIVGALHALAAAVNQPDLGEARLARRVQVLVDHGRSRRAAQSVQIDRVLDRDRERFVVHGTAELATRLLRPRLRLYSAVTLVVMPPRAVKSPITVMRRGAQAATRSSRIWLVAAS